MINDRNKMKWWDKFCSLQPYSFIRGGGDRCGVVIRVCDNSGNWLDRQQVQSMADEVQSRINELEAENALLKQERDQLKAVLHDVNTTDYRFSVEQLAEHDAQVIENLKFPTMLRRMWSGGEVQAWLKEEANLLRQKAQEAERESGK